MYIVLNVKSTSDQNEVRNRLIRHIDNKRGKQADDPTYEQRNVLSGIQYLSTFVDLLVLFYWFGSVGVINLLV
jgi:hypothetical protein